MNGKLDDLLTRKMDRKEFLRHIGYGTLVLFGFGSALKTLASLGDSAPKNQMTNARTVQPAGSGYGNGAYGG